MALFFKKPKVSRKKLSCLYKKNVYYKPAIKNNFWHNNYVEYKINNDRNRILSVEEYLNKISPYLRDINDLKHMKNSIKNDN